MHLCSMNLRVSTFCAGCGRAAAVLAVAVLQFGQTYGLSNLLYSRVLNNQRHTPTAQLDERTMQVTELPIRKWTQDYKEFLEGLIKPENPAAEAPLLLDFRDNSNEAEIKMTLQFAGAAKLQARTCALTLAHLQLLCGPTGSSEVLCGSTILYMMFI